MPTRRPPTDSQTALFKPPPGAQPLAARMRPRTLAEYVGQAHLVGPDGPLRRSVERGYLSSILLWGPPGTGKTSLARLLSDAAGAEFMSLSAVMSGVADIRSTVAAARERLSPDGARTVLF
ncbi:MAG: AAA family ATPase, partial [Candidatus Limnocylindrales bacterium]